MARSLSSIVDDRTEGGELQCRYMSTRVMLQCLVISRAFGIAFGLSDPVSSGPFNSGLWAYGQFKKIFRTSVVLTCL